MMYEDVISDFAKRTLDNLETIERLAKEGNTDVFEATQLVNSMLGLLVFPREEHVNCIPETPVAELYAKGWPKIRSRVGSDQIGTLQDLVRYLRNSIAHFNIEFVYRADKQIVGLKLWNKDRNDKRTWEAVLGLDDLKCIAKKFIEVLRKEEVI